MQDDMTYYCPACSTDEKPIAIKSNYRPVKWEVVVGTRIAEFSVHCCPMCAQMCDILPTMKTALWESEPVKETYKRFLKEKGAEQYGPSGDPWNTTIPNSVPCFNPYQTPNSGRTTSGGGHYSEYSAWDQYMAWLKAEWLKRHGRSNPGS